MNLVLLAAVILPPAVLAQQTLVAPNGYAAVDGNSNQGYPWGIGATNLRNQFIYDSSTFTAQGVVTPVTITRLRFRADGVWATNWTGGTYPQVQIEMSNCPVDHLAASPVFANNHGANRVTVLNGPVNVIPGTNTSPGPGPWYVDIQLTTPFTYNPLMGEDLTIDIHLNGTSWTGGSTGTAPFDAVSGAFATPPPLGTRVFDDVSGTANGTTGTVENDYAAVCEFSYGPASGMYPGFTATPTGGTSPLTVQFTDVSYTSDAGGVQGWQWDFDGDGIVDSNLRNPSFTYTGCGDFNVSLTTFDASHAPATLTRNAYVRTDLLQASFTKTNLGNGLFSFTDTTTPTPQAWAWDFDGDGIIDSTQQNPTWGFVLNCNSNNITLVATLNCRTSTATDSLFVAPAALTAVPFTGGSGYSGVPVGTLFNIAVTAPEGISVCALTQAIWNYNGPFQADVYVTPDTYVGKDTNASLWRLVGSGIGVASTPNPNANAPSHDDVHLNSPFYLPAGNYGVAVYLNAMPAGLMFLAASSGNQGPFSNADLTINPTPAAANGIVKYNLFGAGRFSSRAWNGTLHYTKVSLTGSGGFGFFGAGCAGSLGISNLSTNMAPRLGQTLLVSGNNAPANAGFGLLGFSKTTSAFGPLPFDLTAIGAPNCFGRVSIDASAFLLGGSNNVTWILPIPASGNLLGVRAFTQVLVLDAGINSLGAVASDAAGFIIGL